VTPEQLAEIYKSAFTNSRAWEPSEFTEILAQPTTFLVEKGSQGFAIGRAVTGEAELITLAVAPKTQRQGVGRTLLTAFQERAASLGATRLFLEVSEDNLPAITLYRTQNWAESGRRKSYYKRANGVTCDSILFEKKLT